MKPLSAKVWVIFVSTAVTLFIVGSAILVRQKSRRFPEPLHHTQRYPHEHLREPEWEPRAKLQAVTYTLREDETLAKIARLRYGHQNYHRVIKLYNHIEDDRTVKPNDTLRVPDISVILAEEGVNKVVAPEVRLILCSRAKYDRVVDRLWALRVQPNGNYVLPEDVKQELNEAADDLQQATESLKSTRPGVSAVPTSMIGQLEQTMDAMRALAAGEHSDPNGYDIDIVQQRYALALTYSIIWAREGFR